MDIIARYRKCLYPSSPWFQVSMPEHLGALWVTWDTFCLPKTFPYIASFRSGNSHILLMNLTPNLKEQCWNWSGWSQKTYNKNKSLPSTSKQHVFLATEENPCHWSAQVLILGFLLLDEIQQLNFDIDSLNKPLGRSYIRFQIILFSISEKTSSVKASWNDWNNVYRWNMNDINCCRILSINISLVESNIPGRIQLETSIKMKDAGTRDKDD